MSDLISRSELLNAFNNKNIQITFDLPVEEILGEDVDLDDFAMLVQDAIQVYKKMVIDTIKNQPTAYDIDKVVEELKKSTFYIEQYCAIDPSKAIEIVEQGCAEEHEQFVEKEIRNKAIDDFKDKINELEKLYKEKYGCEIVEMYSEIVSDIKGWIAEQLKAGREND